MSTGICYNKREVTMRKDYATKTIILHIFAVLQKYTSREHQVSFNDIATFLEGKGKSCDRKTVARNVDYLIEDGFPIVKTGDGKCYYDREKTQNK